MKLIMENWRNFLSEEKEVEDTITKVLKDEGGAAGLEPIEKALEGIEVPEEFNLVDFLKGMSGVGQHEDGDYILADDKQIRVSKDELQEAIDLFLEEKEIELDEKKKKKSKKKKSSGKKDACYNKVKSRYKVWPSAYASGALVKCRKVGAANWGNKSKKKK